MDHWEKIIIHATEQSNGLYLPVIDKVMSLEDFINKHSVNQYHNICFNIMGPVSYTHLTLPTILLV